MFLSKRSLVKLFFKSFALLCSSFLAYKISYFVAETYFFDKFFFNKSIVHGYTTPQLKSWSDFSPRSDDLVTILNQAQVIESGQSPKVLGTDSETYTIALIGDSFVWGQGLRVQDTFGSVLEKKLNELRKTNVLTLAQSGDSILDHYQKYIISQRIYHVDLYVFLLVENDLVLNNDPRYLANNYKEIIHNCEEQTGTNITKFSDRQDVEDDYGTLLAASPKNPANLCVLNYVSSKLPKARSIYLIGDDYIDNKNIYNEYAGSLKRNGLRVLSLSDTKDLPKYQDFWKDTDSYFPVSHLESHPSRYMSEMYSDIIYEQLINSTELGFEN